MEEKENRHDGVILLADDDMDNHLIVKCALEQVGFRGLLHSVKDGMELMDFLYRRGRHKFAWTPDLILLDLNMPEKDGRAALREIRDNPSLRSIPVAVLTSSTAEEDIELCSRYRNCSYTTKPSAFQEWIRCLEEILTTHLRTWDPAFFILEEEVECFKPQ